MFLTFLKTGLNFIYPPICIHCGKRKDEMAEFICVSCWNQIKPYRPDLDVMQVLKSRMTGRIPAHQLFTLFWYQHSSPLKTLFQNLKYQNRKEIGLFLGKFLGQKIENDFLVGDKPAFLVPVPVHKLKQIDRGYNQALVIAQGIANNSKKVIFPEKEVIFKSRQTESQTKKNRFSRWQSQHEVFELNPEFSQDLNNRQIILVDDIITTGATLEQAGKLILSKWPEAQISIATLALTE